MSNICLSCGYVAFHGIVGTNWYYPGMPKEHAGRRYDLWWEDPGLYHEHLKELGESQVYFSVSYLKKFHIDPLLFMRQNFHGLPWKCYVVGMFSGYGFDYTCDKDEYTGVWPTWRADHYNLKELQDYIENPWADQKSLIPEVAKFNPVPGQQHRVFVRDLKTGQTEMERERRRRMTKVQKLYPEVELFVRPFTFNMALLFGAGFSAGCLNPHRILTQRKGAVYLPNGLRISRTDIPKFEGYFEYFGFDTKDIQNDRDATMLYMITSLRYAAHHWDDPTGIFPRKSSKYRLPDFNNPDMYAPMPSYEVINNFKGKKAKSTDKILCNSCSLWRKCPAYRPEEVCGLPNTESRKLADLALSRNADDVVEMLASIVSKQAERAEKRISEEHFAADGHDKEIDKMLNNVFKNGVQLAKLRDPTLGRAPLVQINNHGQAIQQVANSDPRALGATVIRELEDSGVRREDITEQMIADHISKNYATKQLESGDTVDAEIVQ